MRSPRPAVESEEEEDGSLRASCMSHEQLLQRISLPLTAGGLGERPVHRIRHAVYFASLLRMLPDFLRMFPELQAEASSAILNSVAAMLTRAPAVYQLTELHAELELCRTELLAAAAGNRRSRRQGAQLPRWSPH